jgi:isopenicillin-N epimerase
MSLTRRNFLIRGSLSLAAGALSSVLVEAKTRENAPVDFKDWESVRRQFDLAPDYIHLALFFLASHPRPVRQAIEQYRAKIDANPLLTVENAIFVHTDENIPWQVCRAMANYIGGDAQDIALTQNTTTGLALLYHGRDPDHYARPLCASRINPAGHGTLRSDLAQNSTLRLLRFDFAR